MRTPRPGGGGALAAVPRSPPTRASAFDTEPVAFGTIVEVCLVGSLLVRVWIVHDQRKRRL